MTDYSTCNHSSEHNRQSSDHESTNTQTQMSHGRTPEELEYYRAFLDQLLGVVRDGNQATVERVLSVIRSGASHQEIFAAMSEVLEINGQPNGEGHRETRA